MGSHTSLHDAGNRRRHLRGYHHGPGENRRPVNRLNTQPENNLHHALGHYRFFGTTSLQLSDDQRQFENQMTATEAKLWPIVAEYFSAVHRKYEMPKDR